MSVDEALGAVTIFFAVACVLLVTTGFLWDLRDRRKK